MRYHLISLILLAGLFSGCQKNENLNRQVKDEEIKSGVEVVQNEPKIMSGAMSDIKSMILTYNEKQSSEKQKQINVEKENWEFIFKILDSSVYNESQYDKEKNPGGIMRKVVGNDFTVTIEYKSGKNDTIFVWKVTNEVKINGKWYFTDEKYKGKLSKLLEDLEEKS